MDKSKSHCDICKISVPSSYMHKHQTSERHLRSKAAKMFYKSKSNNKTPYKKAKYDDSFLDLNINNKGNIPQQLQVSTINSQVKGI